MTAVVAGVVLCAFSVATIQADSALPDAVPDDFPFPEDASLQVKDGTSGNMIRIAVSFSFESDPDRIYSTLRSYAVENGYEISTEDEPEYNFSSVDYSSGDGIGVRISDMESVNIATVTFSGVDKD